MTNIILVAVLVIIIGGASGYIYKAKKSGVKCIGCPAGKTCGGHQGACSGSCASCAGGCSGHVDGKR